MTQNGYLNFIEKRKQRDLLLTNFKKVGELKLTLLNFFLSQLY